MIEIVDYRSVWPAEFAALGAALRSRIRETALAIHHIGSTAVPGLAAKDVIDIQMTVADLDSLPSAAIEAAGFKRHQVRTDHLPPGMTLPPGQLEKRRLRLACADHALVYSPAAEGLAVTPPGRG